MGDGREVRKTAYQRWVVLVQHRRDGEANDELQTHSEHIMDIIRKGREVAWWGSAVRDAGGSV